MTPNRARFAVGGRCRPHRCARWLAAGWLALGLASGAEAAVLRACQPASTLSATQQDRLLRFSAVIKSELDASGRGLALVARAGLDLSRFDQRYSHAGFSLRAGEQGGWTVRQLYYACDEGRPRIYDQGLAGFVFGGSDPALGHVSAVLLPADASATLEHTVRDRRQALELLGARYSANAHAFGLRYQNCNQWVAEVLALAWGGLTGAPDSRARAQDWLQMQSYEPARFAVDNPLLLAAAAFVPWLHSDDHPADDLEARRFRVSMPAAIEAFVRRLWPTARRIEFCHTERHIVVRQGWTPIAEGCRPGPDDRVIGLDAPADVPR